MKKKLLFELKSIYRDSMRINGFEFGSSEKSVCIVGGMHGNEMQQVYCSSCRPLRCRMRGRCCSKFCHNQKGQTKDLTADFTVCCEVL